MANKRLVEATGGTCRPVHLEVDPVVLRQRLDDRAERFPANAAFGSRRTALHLSRWLRGVAG